MGKEGMSGEEDMGLYGLCVCDDARTAPPTAPPRLGGLNSQTKCNTWLRCCHGKKIWTRHH